MIPYSLLVRVEDRKVGSSLGQPSVIMSIDGFTYERQSLLDHFARNGNFDPITGRPCTEKDLVPNRSLKEAIEDFLRDNGWAAGKCVMQALFSGMDAERLLLFA